MCYDIVMCESVFVYWCCLSCLPEGGAAPVLTIFFRCRLEDGDWPGANQAGFERMPANGAIFLTFKQTMLFRSVLLESMW